jgi:hypothetical protein
MSLGSKLFKQFQSFQPLPFDKAQGSISSPASRGRIKEEA